MIDGILWSLRAGTPWRDLPETYGPWTTVYCRFVRWRRNGTWDRLLAHVQMKSDAAGEVVWEVSVDSTSIRAHQHAAGARTRPAVGGRAATTAAGEALERSRGGLTTKIHLACDGKGGPLAMTVTPGQRHDSTQLAPVLDAIRVPPPGGRGRPRKRPDHLIGDKAYSHSTCRALLRRRGIPHTIPERRDQRERQARRPGRPQAFDPATYRRRNVTMRCVNHLQQWRGVATRFEKHAANYRAMVVVAALILWLAP